MDTKTSRRGTLLYFCLIMLSYLIAYFIVDSKFQILQLTDSYDPILAHFMHKDYLFGLSYGLAYLVNLVVAVYYWNRVTLTSLVFAIQTLFCVGYIFQAILIQFNTNALFTSAEFSSNWANTDHYAYDPKYYMGFAIGALLGSLIYMVDKLRHRLPIEIEENGHSEDSFEAAS